MNVKLVSIVFVVLSLTLVIESRPHELSKKETPNESKGEYVSSSEEMNNSEMDDLLEKYLEWLSQHDRKDGEEKRFPKWRTFEHAARVNSAANHENTNRKFWEKSMMEKIQLYINILG